MDGFELYDKMKEIDNEVKVCFMTAYDINIKALRAVYALSSDLEAYFIRKPIDMQEFIARINQNYEQHESSTVSNYSERDSINFSNCFVNG